MYFLSPSCIFAAVMKRLHKEAAAGPRIRGHTEESQLQLIPTKPSKALQSQADLHKMFVIINHWDLEVVSQQYYSKYTRDVS